MIITDEYRLDRIRERSAARTRSEAGWTGTQDQADVGFLLRQLADRDERLRACGVLAEPLTSSPDDDSLTAHAIQHVAAGRKTPAEAIEWLGEEWAGALDRQAGWLAMTEPDRWVVSGGRMGGKRKAFNDEIEARLLAGWTEVTGNPVLRMDGLRLFEAPSRPGILERTGGDERLARICLDAARRLLPDVRAHDAALGPTAMHLDETTAERRAVLDLLDESLAENAELRRQADRVARVIDQRDAAWAREGELSTALRGARDELAALKGGAGTSEASRA